VSPAGSIGIASDRVSSKRAAQCSEHTTGPVHIRLWITFQPADGPVGTLGLYDLTL